MYAPSFAEMSPVSTRSTEDESEIIESLLEMRERALASRDFLYTPLLSQHLIEQEIPRLIAMIETRRGIR